MSGALFKGVLNIVYIFLYNFQYINAVNSTVYLIDPSRSSKEEAESIRATNKFRYILVFIQKHTETYTKMSPD